MTVWQEFQGITRGGTWRSCIEPLPAESGSVDPAHAGLYFERGCSRAAAARAAPARARRSQLPVIVGGHHPGRIDPEVRPPRRRAIARASAGRRSTLHAATHGLGEDDLRTLRPISSAAVRARRADASGSIERLRRVYCSTVGYDYAQMFVPEEREWLPAGGRGAGIPSPRKRSTSTLLDRISRSRCSSASSTGPYPARTVFSIEGWT